MALPPGLYAIPGTTNNIGVLYPELMCLSCQDNTQLIDNSETVHISSLALLKMLRHGRAGVPMEVMGLMLGEFVDDFTVRVVDVFAMPQSGTGVSVEAVDPVFQMKMMDMLRQTGRYVKRSLQRRFLANG